MHLTFLFQDDLGWRAWMLLRTNDFLWCINMQSLHISDGVAIKDMTFVFHIDLQRSATFFDEHDEIRLLRCHVLLTLYIRVITVTFCGGNCDDPYLAHDQVHKASSLVWKGHVHRYMRQNTACDMFLHVLLSMFSPWYEYWFCKLRCCWPTGLDTSAHEQLPGDKSTDTHM